MTDNQTTGRCGVDSPWRVRDSVAPESCALPAGHDGWHHSDTGAEWGVRRPFLPETELREGVAEQGLTAEQEIRARAITAAVPLAIEDKRDSVYTIADRIAAYIRDGRTP